MELLTQCIYGVDKDEQAVAVARLNLMLKALHSRERLPLLENIRCGDSLISGTAEELKGRVRRRLAGQAAVQLGGGVSGGRSFFFFFFILADGGFDVIVGNPPYVRQETLGEAFKAYVASRYATHAGTADLYVYFIERAMQSAETRRLLRIHRRQQVAAQLDQRRRRLRQLIVEHRAVRDRARFPVTFTDVLSQLRNYLGILILAVKTLDPAQSRRNTLTQARCELISARAGRWRRAMRAADQGSQPGRRCMLRTRLVVYCHPQARPQRSRVDLASAAQRKACIARIDGSHAPLGSIVGSAWARTMKRMTLTAAAGSCTTT